MTDHKPSETKPAPMHLAHMAREEGLWTAPRGSQQEQPVRVIRADDPSSPAYKRACGLF